MRSVINISLPEKLAKDVDKVVKSGKYASKSEFFRDLLRFWQEERLSQELLESKKEISQGKGKVLKSLKDLR